MSTSAAASAPVYALLADGSTIEIRPATSADRAEVESMHEAMSPGNTYLRFFSPSRMAGRLEAQRLCRAPGPDHLALLALAEGRIAGSASYELTGQPGVAEIAFAVADQMHGRGVGTLLLEHLVSAASRSGVRTFTACVLAENAEMLKVFARAGLHAQRTFASGAIELSFSLPRSDDDPAWADYQEAVDRRDSVAGVASLRPLLRPESVAVVGASRRPGTVGRAILHNIIDAGYAGRLYAVNPHAQQIEGVACLPSVSELPEPADLAVIAVPPAAVPGAAGDAGRRGVKSLVVITSGLGETEGAGLLAACRKYGMRLAGPNCFGVAVPGIGLDATFAASHPSPGTAGLVLQSGGLGFALAEHLSRLGVGISSFASVGDKYDVSSNDMLMWWECDGTTKLAVLYIESFGNPRRFARTARRVGKHMPVLTVHAGRSQAGQQAAASHTAAVATPLVSRDALFRQAGIIATSGMGELLEVAALLATQPLAAGGQVAIVSNVGGAGVLTADACAEAGLAVHRTTQATGQRLRALIPAGGAVAGPLDTTATISRSGFCQCVELAAADEGVDAVIAAVLPTAATGDLMAAIGEAEVNVPLVAVQLDQPETVRLVDGASGRIPVYANPEAAARALGYAARHGAWRARRRDPVPQLGGTDVAAAHEITRRFLTGAPAGGWLSPAQTSDLLACYHIPVAETRQAHDADSAVSAAESIGWPVVLKAAVPGLIHKSDARAVKLGLRTSDDVGAAFAELARGFGARLTGVVVQPMIAGGTEVIAGVTEDPTFGPLVVFGLGGVATEVLADHAARLVPLTAADADEMIRELRSAPLLLGHRGTPPADMAGLRDLLLRVSRLADDLPEVAELDLNPVIAQPDHIVAVDARIRIAPAQPYDPFLRKLR